MFIFRSLVVFFGYMSFYHCVNKYPNIYQRYVRCDFLTRVSLPHPTPNNNTHTMSTRSDIWLFTKKM